MPFRYYERLRPKEKEIYLKSDSITSVPIKGIEPFLPLISGLEECLKRVDTLCAERFCQEIANVLCQRLGVAFVRIKVLDVRPSNRYGELHGLYYPALPGLMARITLWMRTAKKANVVAFRTFLRTFIHEFCHHLDYELFKFPESFHTEGFYKRESHIFHQLMEAM